MKKSELRMLVSEYKKIKIKMVKAQNKKLKELEHRYFHETGSTMKSDFKEIT